MFGIKIKFKVTSNTSDNWFLVSEIYSNGTIERTYECCDTAITLNSNTTNITPYPPSLDSINITSYPPGLDNTWEMLEFHTKIDNSLPRTMLGQDFIQPSSCSYTIKFIKTII